jgi:hypothetical protein
MKRILFTVLAAFPLAAHAAEPSIADLDFLIGEWQGQSTFHFPREPERERLNEAARASCGYALKDTYIVCDVAFTRPEGRTRTLRIHFNHNPEAGAHQALFLYDNWAEFVSLSLRYDDASKGYVAYAEYYGPNGEVGEERIVWRASDDRREIRSEEHNRLNGEPEIRWRLNFDFVWRRVDGSGP